jgi:hypothetical protein
VGECVGDVVGEDLVDVVGIGVRERGLVAGQLEQGLGPALGEDRVRHLDHGGTGAGCGRIVSSSTRARRRTSLTSRRSRSACWSTIAT